MLFATLMHHNHMTDPNTTQTPVQDETMGLSPEILEYLRNTHIYFALPMYGGMCSESTFSGLMRFAIIATKLKINFSMDIIYNESLIPRARNNLVAKFMGNKDATHLMFIDVDLGFEAESILKLLLNNQDIIGGLYPKKSLPISYVVNQVENPVTDGGDIVEISTLGTGFMLIKRHVIEKMIAHHPELKIRDSLSYAPECEIYMYSLFDTLIDPHHNYLSEDWTFCYRWRLMGGKVFANTSIKLDHTGFYKFAGDPAELKRIIGKSTQSLDAAALENSLTKNEESEKVEETPDTDKSVTTIEESIPGETSVTVTE